MSLIPDEIKNRLQRLPLVEVMAQNGYKYVSRNERTAAYLCPFHADSTPSFQVEIVPRGNNPLCGFKCHGGCTNHKQSQGYGAITLQMRLSELVGEPCSFVDAAKLLCRQFGIEIPDQSKNDFWHRSEKVDPVDLPVVETDTVFTENDLYALGINDRSLFGEKSAEEVLTGQFNLRPLRSFTFAKKKHEVVDKETGEVKEEWSSARIKGSDSYPMFLYSYQDNNGVWCRKYEPYANEANKGNRFMWFTDGGAPRNFTNCIYGDNELMAVYNGEKELEMSDQWLADYRRGHGRVSSEERPTCIKTISRYDAEGVRHESQERVFKRVILCSGPRDAIHVYLHSDAHVVFPHSEVTGVKDKAIRRLLEICETLYICYDIDHAGEFNANRIALSNMCKNVRVIHLPDDLRTLTSTRSGKPCKDAEEFFNYYPQLMHRDESLSLQTIDQRFAALVTTARCLQFWDVRYTTRKDENGEKTDPIEKFEINFESMKQFLVSQGFFKYRDESGNDKFVTVRNNKVSIVDEAKAKSTASEIMKRWLELNPRFYREDLANAISTQKKVSRETMADIASTQLDFMSWNKDTEYFFFRNTAVRVTATEIKAVAYKDLDFQVNADAVIDFDYIPSKAKPLFEIIDNPLYDTRREQFEQMERNKQLTKDQLDKERAQFTAFERLYRYRLRFLQEMDEAPATLQFLYDTCRIHWRAEDQNGYLSEEEKQRQDMHFVNKVALIGYVLCRYRTGAMQQMGILTDYSVVDESRSSGGTGKSIVRELLGQVRKVCLIPGKGFKKKENMARNFQEFRDTIDSICFIDDLREDVAGDEFYNITQNITVKTLYNNEVTLPQERTPKLLITTNKMSFDLNEPSTSRRVFVGMMSDYYHPADYSGKVREWSPYTKFGKDIIQEATADERNATIHMMLQCCQFYLGHQYCMVPPMEKDGMMRLLYSSIRDSKFIEWANKYFASPHHIGMPVPRRELVRSYMEACGDEVTLTAIHKRLNEVNGKLETYCRNMNLELNPPIVMMGDKSSIYPRRTVWVTQFVNDRPNYGAPRVWESGVRCYYIYRTGEVPNLEKDVKNAPQTDVEWEEMMKELNDV